MKEVTIVTSLFNIGRDRMDGRFWEEYLKWFDITLQLKCPMILFVTEDIVSFVEERRVNIPTDIIVQSVDEVPYQYLKDQLDAIINSEEYKDKILDPSRIECQYSVYSIIQYSKFKWIKKSIELNCFDSDYYFWIDAGASRFFEEFNLENSFPGECGIEALYGIGEKVLLQLNTETYHDLVYSETLEKEYFYDPRSFVCGTFFGMHKNIHSFIEEKIENILINGMIGNNNLNNEQIALAYLVKNEPNLFEVYYRNTWRQIQLFLELAQ